MFSPNACVEKTSDQNLITQSQTLPNNLDNDNTSNTGKKEEIKQYGITSPVNVDPPTKKEIIKTREFLTYFQSLNILEPKEAMSKKYPKFFIFRLILLDKLNKLTKNWITEFLIKKRMPSSDAQAIGGHIRTFGSYRLGVNTIGGDIDAVLIVPMHIERKDFFESFSTFLRSRSDVKNLRCITEAYVPVMKFLFCDVEVGFISLI
uniref:Poly(A) polymerase gamma (Trinotate prediction) n=1 Tax=Henneguya salminicola TaxID=69463 RepID=A0A6G3MES9_HENSL